MSELRQIAALYIDPRGPYPKMTGVDCWDETRDARLYAGPHPVVAHPPCGPWSSLRHLHSRPAEKSLAIRALAQVRAFGGVLEHPATSRLWAEEYLPGPLEFPDGYGGITLDIQQCNWGHPARKRTRLYVVGVSRFPAMPPPREPTHWCSGVHTPGARGETPPGVKVCSAQQRRRTPQTFAEWLVSLARASRVETRRIEQQTT
jgi:hypothetical protein